MRRQLAFDIWPLCLAIFAITIFERGKIMDPEKSEWFTIFRIIFECTSAYSTIGLSLGTPNNNWSFCGEFGTASKLVVSVLLLLLLSLLPQIVLLLSFHFQLGLFFWFPFEIPLWLILTIDDWGDATRSTQRFTSSYRSVCPHYPGELS